MTVLMVLVGTTLAFVLGRRLERPIRTLATATPRLVKSEPVTLCRSSVTEMNAVAAAEPA